MYIKGFDIILIELLLLLGTAIQACTSAGKVLVWIWWVREGSMLLIH